MDEKQKQSFVLYADIREPLSELSDEQVGRLFRAVLDYVADGKRPKFKGALGLAFAFVRSSIDRNAEKYQRTIERRRAAGRAGGQASAEARKKRAEEQENDDEANQANSTFANDRQRFQANQAVPVPVPVPVPDPVPVPVIDNLLNNPSTLQEGYHSNNTSAELLENSSPLQLRLADGSLYPIKQSDVELWRRTFPGVDVEQELRVMALWCEDNPKKRKTLKGVRRFVSGWLGKAQNHAASTSPPIIGEDPADDEFNRQLQEIIRKKTEQKKT